MVSIKPFNSTLNVLNLCCAVHVSCLYSTFRLLILFHKTARVVKEHDLLNYFTYATK